MSNSMDAHKLFKKAHKALGSPYSGGVVPYRDIARMEHLRQDSACLYHVVEAEAEGKVYKIIILMTR